MGHWRLKPPETAFRLRQPKTGGKCPLVPSYTLSTPFPVGELRGALSMIRKIGSLDFKTKLCIDPEHELEFTAMPVAVENASGTMVESSSAGATAIAAKLIPFLSHHSLNPIGSCYIFAF
ncbi:hypothetical protein OIU74_021674 [Salix koriyanagi]|uniref:Uncharacterized protein n=1 Tax=Salix koriyanagi TaxID=2511006 RepID=A0A9Q0WIN5_9ROSI|nr:hypothetical protein OIU74_021674 [Salix koriyanagi]